MRPGAGATRPAVGGGLELAVFFGDTVATHALPPRGRVTLGRAEDSDVAIAHPSVSRRHAVLHMGPPLLLQDLGGANGTLLSKAADHGEPPAEPRERGPQGMAATLDVKRLSRASAEIAPGDGITLGTVLVVLRRVVAWSPGAGAHAMMQDPGVVLKDPAMRALYEQASLAARGLISALLLGETGVGKEVLARVIHERSPRASRAFLGLNCAALSESLLESELFGHEKGAFTGALESRPGLFEAADGGTVFLDEIGEMPLSTQVKLLRVIEERRVLRVGGRSPRAIDVRFLSATHRDLEAEVARGAFRQDLYFRLNGITLSIPPLRQRVGEIADLARVFLARAAAQLDRATPLSLSDEALELLQRHAWPGNVRELRNVIERAAVLCPGDTLLPADLPGSLRGHATPVGPAPARSELATAPLAATPARRIEPNAGERERILAALEACAGNQTHAAARLGISRQTLIAKIEAHGLPRPRKGKRA